MKRKHELPPGVRGAIAQARSALKKARDEEAPAVKDQEQLVRDVDAWREETFEPIEEAEDG